jgi:flagellar biosynthesis activator protein FlaF
MQGSVQTTYGKVANQTATQRELEANLLLKAASQLQAVRDNWDPTRGDLNDALQYNRTLWTIFFSAVTKADNPLPPAIRENVANLGLFVFKHTLAVIADPRPERLGSLININREVATGLRGRA